MEAFPRDSLIRRAILPSWMEEPDLIFFTTLVSQTSVWPLISRPCSQPSSRVTHRQQVYQTLAKASLSPIPRGANPREVDAFLGNRRDTKSNYVDLRLVHKDGKHPLSPWIYSFAVRNFVDRGWSREIGILGISRDFWGKCLALLQGSFDRKTYEKDNFTY